MSLRDEDRTSLVKLVIEKAERTFAENEGLVEKGYWSTLANRLYYALFHAVSALLIYDHHEVGSHKGAAIRFHQYYVNTGVFSVDDGAFYSQMQTMREKANYNCYYDVEEEEIKAKIEPTRLLIEKIKQMVSDD